MQEPSARGKAANRADKNKSSKGSSSAATVGYEAQLWQMADALRGSMDAAEYKHVVLGLIFLKYISDAFEAKHVELAAQVKQGATRRRRRRRRYWSRRRC